MYGKSSCFGFGRGFGGARDLFICKDSNINRNSYTNLGNSYELPEGLKYKFNETSDYLAGSYKFKVIEIETYLIMN